jgi:hypothetical protein
VLFAFSLSSNFKQQLWHTPHIQNVGKDLKSINMNKIILTSISLIFACNSIFGQTNKEKYANDVKSIDAIIKACYEAASGSSQELWEFERNKSIHSESALIIFLGENGKAEPLTLDTLHIELGLSERKNFYEQELKRKVSQFGNIVQVWSAYEVRNEPDTTTNNRGLASIQLHYEQGRW